MGADTLATGTNTKTSKVREPKVRLFCPICDIKLGWNVMHTQSGEAFWSLTQQSMEHLTGEH